MPWNQTRVFPAQKTRSITRQTLHARRARIRAQTAVSHRHFFCFHQNIL